MASAKTWNIHQKGGDRECRLFPSHAGDSGCPMTGPNDSWRRWLEKVPPELESGEGWEEENPGIPKEKVRTA